ncbi:MAG: urease accessory protein UreE [Chromatiales bacterium]|jgi:urease accessory protein
MLKFTRRVNNDDPAAYSLTLPFEQRIKGRLKVALDNGMEAGLFLDRGPILRGGDRIATDEGQIAEIKAAAETVSTVRSSDALLLARVCYHLGNRHTPLQIENGMARYQHDHVLDDMVRALGLEPVCEQAPFEPEPGAYGEHHSDHAHGGHAHHHGHQHAH